MLKIIISVATLLEFGELRIFDLVNLMRVVFVL